MPSDTTQFIGSGGPNSYRAIYGGLFGNIAKSFEKARVAYGEEATKTASLPVPRGLVRMSQKQRNERREKLATIVGGPNSSELERGFAQIAETYITDKAPLLTNYMLGFQLLKKTDDDTKACGIFAYKVGDELVYIPVFVINGDVQGHELMYVVSRDQFVPSDEKWVNFLLSRKPLEPGRIERREKSEIPTQGLMRPTYMSSGLKLSSYTCFKPLDPMLTLLALKTLFKQASVGTPLLERAFWQEISRTNRIPQLLWKNASCVDMDVTQLFRRSYKATKLAAQWSRDYPVFGRLLDYVMDGEGLDPYLADWQKRAAVAEQLGVHTSAGKTLQQKLAERVAGKTASPKSFTKEGTVAVYEMEKIPLHQFRFMPTALIDRIHRDGYYVSDTRDQAKLASVVTDADSEGIGLCNPVGPGLYKVSMSDGTFREYFLFQKCNPRYPEETGYYVLDKETKHGRFCDGKEIWVAGPSHDPKWLQKIPASNAKIKESADHQWERHDGVDSLLITPAGIAWESNFLAAGDHAYYDETQECPVHCTSSSVLGFRRMCDPGEDRYKEGIPVVCHKDTILRRYKQSRGGDRLQFGTRQLWLARLMEHTVPVSIQKVQRAFSEYAIDDELPEAKSAALESLMTRHHLAWETAEKLLKEADAVFPRTVRRYREKLAFSGPMPLDKFSVTWPKKETGTDGVTGLSVEQDLETEEPVEALRATKVPDERMTWPGMPDAETNSSMGTPAPNAGDLSLASQAAQSGQKDFVSSQMLLSLLREIDNDDLIPKYVNTFEKACDTLGRLYMQLLWRTDAFEERFGKTQLKEFKEMLVNLFGQMGDFICYLRQRDIRPAPVLSLGATNISEEQ